MLFWLFWVLAVVVVACAIVFLPFRVGCVDVFVGLRFVLVCVGRLVGLVVGFGVNSVDNVVACTAFRLVVRIVVYCLVFGGLVCCV